MTTKPFAPLLLSCFLFCSCGQLDSSDSNSPEPPVSTTATFAVQPMKVIRAADVRLSYIGKTVTDTSVFYQVVSTYGGKSVGFNLSLPSGGQSGSARFSSRGGISDDFLRLLQKLYGVKSDTVAKFRQDAFADCFNLAEVYKADSGMVAGFQNKLIFREEADSSMPEMYINVNDKEHWVDFLEKDSIYRESLLRRLTEPHGK
ncbi:MAG: hypothetical protein JST68_22670 [Bacteroidetes bacterium]|nr:hypothetical protein [Bacteroidota bacterium]